MKVNFKRTEDTASTLSVTSDDLTLAASFNGSHESLYWATPLAEDKLVDFQTWKRAGIPLAPMDYTFKGKKFSCEEKECFMTTDMYRGHHNYGMQFFFATVQGKTLSGDTFGIVMQEGIGQKYKGVDRASEDQININGSVHKLD